MNAQMTASNANKKILIADDDSSIRLVLSQAFTRLGYQVRATGNATTLLKWVTDGEGDLVITDVVMPDENVFDVLPRIKKQRPKLPVIVMSAQNNLITAVNAAEVGAFDYIPKPFDLDDMTSAARRALARPADPEAARAQARAVRDDRLPLIGRSGPMQEVYRTIARLVGADLTVLITGESGSGKELVARALHDMGRRRDGKFVTINLAAVPRERVEAELFGREDGDAGKLIDADGGTLFLDEIGDMPLDAQTRLLRVIDGSEPALNPKTGRRPNVRIIAATNRDLRGLIREGLFREDLITARIVERELADHQPPSQGEEGPATLSQIVERKLSSYFADQPDGLPPTGLYDRVLEEVERPLIQLTLSATRGNQVRAAEILGLNRNTLRKKISDLGVEMQRGRR
jgi:two-component system nitrogen regulation response regulator GlnG